jgi:mitochondrial fission protein ELM1
MATTNDKKDSRRNQLVQGFALVWNSQTNRSKRTVATANAMALVKDQNHQQHSNRKKKVRWTKKHDKIAGLLQISTNVHKSVDPSVAKGMAYGSSPAGMGLDVYTSDKGLVHWAEPLGCIFSLVVIPRHKTMERVNSKNTALLVNALNKLQKTERSCKRSAAKTGISTSKAFYAIVGSKVHRGGRGF